MHWYTPNKNEYLFGSRLLNCQHKPPFTNSWRDWSEADKAGMLRFHNHVNPAKNQYGTRYLQTVRRFFCYFDL
jgi:hypothetical protein